MAWLEHCTWTPLMKKLIGAARLIQLERRCWGGQVMLQPEKKRT
jgi:hypothetical protein